MPIDPITAGAGISALGNAIGSLVGNAGNARAQRRANAHNLRMWHLQNAYNDPSAQRARLKAAGLNPNLIYGGSPSSASGNAESVAPAKAAEFNFDNPLKDITQFADVKLRQAQTDNTKEQSLVYTQEAALKAAQTAKTLSEGQSAHVKAEIDRELKQTSMDVAKQGLRNLELETISRELDNRFKDQGMKDRLLDLYYRAQVTSEQAKTQKQSTRETSSRATLNELDIELRRMGINPNDPMYARIIGRLLNELEGGNTKNPAATVESEAERQRKRAKLFKSKNW